MTKGREQNIAGEERLLANISMCSPNPANPRELRSLHKEDSASIPEHLYRLSLLCKLRTASVPLGKQ